MKSFKQYIKSYMYDLSSLNESLLDDEDEINIEKTYNKINEACDVEHDIFFAIRLAYTNYAWR